MNDPQPLLDRKGQVYTPAVSPRLKKLLAAIFAVVALLGANSVYMVSITALGEQYQNAFYILMLGLHLLLGLGLILPFLFFALAHLRTAIGRPNRRAVRAGIVLLTASLVVLISGLVLVRFEGFEVRDPTTRRVSYWLHVICPVLAILCYVMHRMAGPAIKWRWSGAWAGAVGVFVAAMAYLHHQDPRLWYAVGPKEGQRYFEPSAARTATGNFIPARALMMDDYCKKCHPDAYEQHYQSVHHFSSFNNKPYLFSVNETRQIALKRDGTVQASRWCAGCHDPVPFFSGQFDDPKYDIKNQSDPTTQAGLTCTVCHGITNVNSVTGNAAYTIDEPMQYPFAFSDNAILQWINNQLIKAKPALHKKTFMKDKIHRNEEFCSVCHKVSLPFALNHYKDWLRGQNHYDAFLLSGVSGHGAQSFYYPDKAKDRCADCHMPLVASNDFGARDFDQSGTRKIHRHLFLGANTGLPYLRNYEMVQDWKSGRVLYEVPPTESEAYRTNEAIIQAHQAFLRDGQSRIDIFGLKPGGTIDGELIAPLRPAVPALEPGKQYLVEVVVRTLKLGHLFTQGTIDSNEVWVDFEARSGDRVIGRSGALDDQGTVDPWSHFVNALVIDRHGKRIDRRNPQDIYVAVYNHQIPPGAGQVVHYLLDVPRDATEPVRLAARLNYRKFDRTYMEHVFRDDPDPVPNLPITTLCEDAVTLPVAGGTAEVENTVSKIPEWQRWNDYGIGLFLEGEQSSGSEKGELRQAEQAFLKVVDLGRGDGYANLARIYSREGRLDDAVKALQAAAEHKVTFPAGLAGSGPGIPSGAAGQYMEPAPPWTVAWVTGEVNMRLGNLDAAIENFELILTDEMRNGVANRGFDFRRDYRVWNALGIALAQRARDADDPDVRRAVSALENVLAIDPENESAHFKLFESYGLLAGKFRPRGDSAQPPTADAPNSRRITAAELRRLAAELIDAGRSADGRVAAAEQLIGQIPLFLAIERDPFESRHGALVDLLVQCRRAFPQSVAEPLAEVNQAAAGVLHVLHRELHKMYKLDDNARAAVAIHRQNNPAANHAAQSIVIYPLNREGAPGLVESRGADATSSASGGGQ